MILGLLAGLLWFAAFLAAHLAVIRRARPELKARLSQQLFLAGLVGMAASLWLAAAREHESLLARGDFAMALVWGTLTLVGLFVLYMPFYYTIVASLSVRTMIMLRRTSDSRMRIEELREEFVSRHLIAQRLATMTTNGFLIDRREGYQLTLRGRSVARIFSWIKRFWRLGPGG